MRRVCVIAFVSAGLIAGSPLASAQIVAGMSAGGGTNVVSLTVGTGADGLLVVAVAVRNASTTVESVTFGGQPLERVGDPAGASGCFLSLWRLVAPASGTHNLAAQLSSSELGMVAATAYEGVDPTSLTAPPTGLGGTTRTISIDTASAPGYLVVGTACARGSASGVYLTMTPGQNFRISSRLTDLAIALGDQAGSPSVTLGWSIGQGGPAVSWTAATFPLYPVGQGVGLDAGTPDAGQDLASLDGPGDPSSGPTLSSSPDAGSAPADVPTGEDPAPDAAPGTAAVDLHVVTDCSFHPQPHVPPPLLVIACLGLLLRRVCGLRPPCSSARTPTGRAPWGPPRA